VNEPVQAVLELRRARSVRRQQLLSIGAAVALHGLLVAAAFATRIARAEREFPDYVAVHVLPATALGVERPRPTPPEPAPAPPVEPEPAPEPPPPEPDPEIPVLPREEVDREPEPAPPPKPAPRPEPRPAEPTRADRSESATGPLGSPRGTPGGRPDLGAQVFGPAGASFPYDYYLDQMLARIRQSWARPPVQGIEALLTFRVLRNGEVVEVEVRESSGSRAFDLAALRAVRNASPLPPLPASYREDVLTVNLIVR
jgi:TonB family protein